MEGQRDFYGQWNRPEAFIARLKSDPVISQENKDTILAFIEDIEARGLSASRVRKYISAFRALLNIAHEEGLEGFTFKDATEADIRTLAIAINRSDRYKEWTKTGYKVAIKQMYKFLTGEERPDITKCIKTTPKSYKRTVPEDLLSREEVEALILACQNERDRAFISVLYESGARIAELASMRVKDVTFNGSHVSVLLPEGKTGPRRLPLVDSIGYLRTWLRVHPLAEMDRDGHLWVKVEKLGRTRDGKKGGAVAMNYAAIVSMLRKRADRAKIPRSKVNPHNFRHSRATELANKLTEAQMCQYFGWVPGSDMTATYVHLSGRDLDKTMLDMHGLTEEEVPTEPRVCPSCGERNPAGARYCNRCQFALDTEAALSLNENRGGLDQGLDELLKQPGVLEGIVNGAKDKAKVLQILARIAGNGESTG